MTARHTSHPGTGSRAVHEIGSAGRGQMRSAADPPHWNWGPMAARTDAHPAGLPPAKWRTPRAPGSTGRTRTRIGLERPWPSRTPSISRDNCSITNTWPATPCSGRRSTRFPEGVTGASCPQDLEQRDIEPMGIRDQDLKAVMECDLALFNFDGSELPPGAVIEYMYAKMLDIPAVILRTDFRHGGDQSPDADPLEPDGFVLPAHPDQPFGRNGLVPAVAGPGR